MMCSKRHNKLSLLIPAKAIYGSFGRIGSTIFNVVNYRNLDEKIQEDYACIIIRSVYFNMHIPSLYPPISAVFIFPVRLSAISRGKLTPQL